MEGGISLQKMIDNNVVLSTQALQNLIKMRYILIENKIAHCDIKPSNIVVKSPGDQLFLIDNDDIVNFG